MTTGRLAQAHRLSLSAARRNTFSLVALTLVVLLTFAYSFGENGDPGFAGLCDAVAVGAFALGTRTGRLWTVLVVALGWFIGWLLVGSIAAQDTYTGFVAFTAPFPALFMALGVGARRQRARGTAARHASGPAGFDGTGPPQPTGLGHGENPASR